MIPPLFYSFLSQVYEAVMNWVNANIDDRNIELSHLMEYVRLPLLPQDYLLQHVETNTLMRSNAHCRHCRYRLMTK